VASDLTVSIILCTRNRAAGLKRTLEALDKVRIPLGWRAEVLVVDNGSTDGTAAAARDAKVRNLEMQYVYEPHKGKSYALNAGLAHARGEIIFTTDDDVIVPEDWIEDLVSVLVGGGYDAVTGRVALAPHLLRPWMTPMHRLWLASSDDAQLHEGSRELIGASMAFRRAVLERVPAFDPELGPGGLGLADDTLFGWQLIEAGFKIGYAHQPAVLHHLDSLRLRRTYWLDDARKRGRTTAYLRYHWEHTDTRHPRLEWLVYWAKLRLRRLLQPPPPLEAEGCAAWEISYVLDMERCRQFCVERQRPRNYARRGLAKRNREGRIAGGRVVGDPEPVEHPGRWHAGNGRPQGNSA
jgi:glycosyltransferase involved in cell wall biosynthesis